ncbi:unnamed protein product [Rotaria sp. Silwood1]|nr:unnamed protein product [Rotaria sp. Silwood1]
MKTSIKIILKLTDEKGKAISAASESVIDAIVKATKDRPWLWAVYLVAILLPLVILVVFCWSKKSAKKPTDGLKKKTDEVEPDSNEQQLLTSADNDEEVEEIEIDEQEVKPNVANVSGKDALENDDEGQEEEVNATETNEDESNKNSSPSASNKARRRVRKE